MHTFKFIKGVLGVSLLAGLLSTSCNKKISEAYLNPNSPVVEPIETLLPSIEANFVGGANSGNGGNGTAGDALQINRYIQTWAQNSDQYQYDEMGGTTGAQAGTLGYTWTMFYATQGQNINQVIAWGTQQKKWDYVGVAEAIRAWGWLTLSDEYGNIILREAFQTGRTQFDYDTLQSEAYDTVRATCFRALNHLSMTGDSVSPTNLAIGDQYFYGGDESKWKKFVYGVLARSYAHLTDHSTYQPDSVIKYANLAMTSNADNAALQFANTGVSGTMNYDGPFRGNIGSVRQTAWVAGLLSGQNPTIPVADPRAWYLIRENTNGTFKGITPTMGGTGDIGLTTTDQPQGFWGQSYTTTTAASDTNARYVFRNAAPYPIMTAAEMQFLIAEAAYRKGDKATALTAYTTGINLSFDMLTSTYNVHIPAADVITPATQATYMAAVVPTDPSQLTLSQIMLQKYIALFVYGAHETWVDMRRFHYTDLDPVTGQQVYANFQLPPIIWTQNGNKPVYRARPQNTSEYQYNILAVTAMGGTAIDYCTRQIQFSINGF